MKRYKYLRSQDKLSIQVFIIVWITFSVLLTLYPVFITIVNSLKSDYSIRASIFTMPELFGGEFGATVGENYKIAWNGTETIVGMKVYFLRSVLLAFIGAFFTCVIGTILGYIFTYKEFHFKEVLFMVYLAVMMLPSIMGMPTLIPFVSKTLGLKDTYLGYLLPILSGGQVTSLFLFRTFFSQQPKSLYESARLDGANDFILITRITIPLAFPIILYHFIGSFSSIYNEYLWASLILRENQTLTSLMHSLVSSDTTVYGESYAMYVISSFPLIITTIISMKYFKSGEFAAGLKL